MVKKINSFLLIMVVASAMLILPNVHATSLTLLPANTDTIVGDTFDIDILADIDLADAIIAFGFDLDLSGTGTLGFNGFTPNSPVFDIDADHALISDLDGILAASGGSFISGPPVSGSDILLGTLSFTATGIGNVQVSLTADDLGLGSWFTEGLIPENIQLDNFMPTVTAANVNIVPEPGTIYLLGIGLLGFVRFRRKTFKN